MIGCGIGLATAPEGVGLLAAGTLCTTALGGSVVEERTGDSAAGVGPAGYGCGAGIGWAFLMENPEELVGGGLVCVVSAAAEDAQSRLDDPDSPTALCDQLLKEILYLKLL